MPIVSTFFRARPTILSMKLAGIKPPELALNFNKIFLIGSTPQIRLTKY
jgi:hypothetical protein